MKAKALFTALGMGLTLLFVSCHKHEDIDVEINVVSPAAGQVVVNPQTTLFQIVFTGSGELHDIRIKVYPKNNPADRVIDFDQHEHTRTYTFSETRDLSLYPAGSIFVLDIEADKDEEGKEIKSLKQEFSIP